VKVKLAFPRLFVLALVLGASATQAEAVNCTPITTLPVVITVQGVYCLKGNLATGMASGNAIDIQTNNVVLDLKGFKLDGLSAGLGTNTFGIYALDRQNITIRNGTIRGSGKGSSCTTPASRRGTSSKISALIRTPKLEFTSAVPATSFATTRSWRQGEKFGPDTPIYGIHISGSGARVLNNDVIDTHSSGTLARYGIFLTGTTGGLVVSNRISVADHGILFSGTGKYRDNLTFGVVFPFSGGTDAGGNF